MNLLPASPAGLSRFLVRLGLVLGVGLLLVWEVGKPTLRVWDEGRLAMSAAEMHRNGNWLVTLFNGKPDYFSTKPPLMIWLQVLSIHLLGYTEWAVRLPSIVAAVGTVGLLYWFGRRLLRSEFVGFFAAFILSSSPGFNAVHVARTGDYDALLTALLTTMALSYLGYLVRRRVVYLLVAALALALALFTKSAAALLAVPALVLYTALHARHWWVFRQPAVYVAGGAAVLPLVLYYVLREQVDPGYWQAAWYSDWAGRFTQVVVADAHDPWWKYTVYLLTKGLLSWSPLLAVGAWVAWHSPHTSRRETARYAVVYSVCFLVLISVARTRLSWYAAPIYPMAALLCALGLEQAVRVALHRWHWPRRLVVTGLALAAVLPAGALLVNINRKLQKDAQESSRLFYGHQLPRLLAARPDLRSFVILQEFYVEPGEYSSALLFKLLQLRQQYPLQPTIIPLADTIRPQLVSGQQVFICDPQLQRQVQRHYRTRPLENVAPCQFVEIMAER